MPKNKKVLLANLGNRNITYEGAIYQDLFKKDESIGTFRQWTKRLYQQFDQEAAHIQLQIIVKLLEDKKVRKGITDIILITTDQKQEAFKSQDTVYEGEIIKLILNRDYPDINVSLDTLDNDVSDTDSIMVTMRNKILQYEYLYGEPHYIYCTSGGTGQMKNSIKLLLDYLLDGSRYDLWYVPFKGSIRKEKTQQYKNILDNIQKENLVENGLFQSALELNKVYSFTKYAYRVAKVSSADKLTLMCYWIDRLNMDQCKPVYNSLSKTAKKMAKLPSTFKEFQQLVMLLDLASKPKYSIRAGLLYQKFIYEYSLRQYTEATVSLAVFYEYYINAIISIHTDVDLLFPPKNNYQEELKKLKKRYAIFPTDSIYHKCNLCLTLDNIGEVSHNFITYVMSRINASKKVRADHALNSMRSKIVHNGRLLSTVKDGPFIKALSHDKKEISAIFGKPDILTDITSAAVTYFRK